MTNCAIISGAFGLSELRKSEVVGAPTEPSALRDFKFSRQHHIGPYFADFAAYAPPDYRTRRQSPCRAGAGAHGCLENCLSHRVGLSSAAILECRSEHRDRRCARSDLCGADGFSNRAPEQATLTEDPLWGAAAAPFPPSGGENYSDNVQTSGARLFARATAAHGNAGR